MGSHDDEANGLRFGHVENYIRHYAIVDAAFGSYPVPRMRLRKLLELLLGMGAKFLADLEVGIWKCIVRVHGRQRLGYVLQHQGRSVMPGERLRVVICQYGEFREIDWAENTIDFQRGLPTLLLD